MAKRRRRSAEQRGAEQVPPPELLGLESAHDAPWGVVGWLVEGAIPESGIALLDGRKGTGKSCYAAALAAAVSGGPPVPGYVRSVPRPVIWCGAEDDWSRVTVPRLRAAGANLRYVYRIKPALVDGRERRLVLPDDLERLRVEVLASRARLVILDPLMALAAPGLDMGTETGARSYLQPLSDLMWEVNCLALGIRHPTKGRGRDLREAGAGHHSITNIARALLRADEHPYEEGKYVLCAVACNYGATLPPQVWTVAITDDGHPRMEWAGEASLSAEEIAQGRGDTAERDEWADADALLVQLIGSEWRRIPMLAEEAEAAGITPRMLRRAKARLRIPSRRAGPFQGGWWEWGPPPAGWPAALAALRLAPPPPVHPPAPSASSNGATPRKRGRRPKAPKIPPVGATPPSDPQPTPSEEENSHATTD